MIEGGQAAAAVELLGGSEARDPDDPRVFKRKGRALARIGDWPGAAAAPSRASSSTPATSASRWPPPPRWSTRTTRPARPRGRAPRRDRPGPRRRARPAGGAPPGDVARSRGGGGRRCREVERRRGGEHRGAGRQGGARAPGPTGRPRGVRGSAGPGPASTDALGGKALAQLLTGAVEEAAASAAALRAVDPEHPLLPMLAPAFDEALTAGGER